MIEGPVINGKARFLSVLNLEPYFFIAQAIFYSDLLDLRLFDTHARQSK